MTDALRDALHQYEQIGPSKMDRAALNLIRDAAAALAKAEALLAECEAVLKSYVNVGKTNSAARFLAKLKARTEDRA